MGWTGDLYGQKMRLSFVERLRAEERFTSVDALVAQIRKDIEATRADLERKGVRFLVDGVAEVARVRTTWFADPWGVVFILVEKSRPNRPYFAQR